MGVTVFCDPPTSAGADFLSELTTQHLLDQAQGTASPPPLSHSQLQLVFTSTKFIRILPNKISTAPAGVSGGRSEGETESILPEPPEIILPGQSQTSLLQSAQL